MPLQRRAKWFNILVFISYLNQEITLIFNKIECPAFQCRMFCENGHVLDKNGCQTCECKEPENSTTINSLFTVFEFDNK